ncbi:MAG: hypothetical protein KA327_10645 [Pseudarcicella sp.]|nr:hypothetical protein [Pseudarcicella sp.]
MNLFPDEYIVTESNNGELVLTTHRIWQKKGSLNSAQTKSIMLEHITSCQTNVRSNIVILLIGILAVIFGFFIDLHGSGRGSEIIKGTSFVTGIVLIITFYWTRKNQIIISSSSANIVADTSSLSQKSVENFIDKVENTKHKRLVQINKN